MRVYRVSHVEAFRRFEVDEDADYDRLVAAILGTAEPTERQLAGTAFHKALELATAQPGDELWDLRADGYLFSFRCDCELVLPPIRELRAEKTYIVDGEPITITGQVDTIEGRRLDDHKTTGRVDPERYLEGYQWRLYLDIFEADHFRWNIFELHETDDPLVWHVTSAHRLEQFRYPALGADCQALVERFARFTRQHIEALAT